MFHADRNVRPCTILGYTLTTFPKKLNTDKRNTNREPTNSPLNCEQKNFAVATSPKKIEAVTKWPVPQTVYDVRSFLGFVGYYRRFIRDFSKIPKPIREVIIGLENQSKRVAKKTLINWSEAAQSVFEVFKELCVNAPILAFPDYKLPFILHTDSSTEGLGAVLYQKQEGKLRVIAYASRSVTKTESNYPTHKLEFLAFVRNSMNIYMEVHLLRYIQTTIHLLMSLQQLN